MQDSIELPRAVMAGAISEKDLAEPVTHRLQDRIRGAFLGAALGDAVGLQVEGCDKFTISDRYSRGIDYPYKGVHGGYPSNDWTDSTDMAILTARTLSAYFRSETEDPVSDLADRLSRWMKNGFPEIGDTAAGRPESVVYRAVTNKDFVTNPLAVASEVRGAKAENGAMVRSIACAFTTHAAAWADTLGHVTHSDPRSLACAVTHTMIIRSLAALSPDMVFAAEDIREPIIAGCTALMDAKQRVDFMVRLTETKELSELELDDRETRSYAVKTMACVVWALRRIIRAGLNRGPQLYKEIIQAVAVQGGDSSANCCAVGAAMGALLGPSALPSDWLGALPNRDWLEREISGFTSAIVPTWG